CKDYNMTSCNMYNKTKIIKKKLLIPDEIEVRTGFENNRDKDKRSSIQRYIDLLADGLHSKLTFEFYGHKGELAIIVENIRETYISYSSISYIPTTFAIRAARPLDKAFILVKPFDVMIWICIPLSFLIILLTMYGIMKKENEYRNMEMPKFYILFWIILRNFLRQDTSINRYVFITFRIMFGCWILTAFVLTSAYVGTLPSFIVNPGTETIPQTFQQLAQSVKEGRYNITFFTWGHESSYFMQLHSDTDFRTKIKNEIIEIFCENVKQYWSSKPIEKVINGTHAILAPKERIELSMSKGQKKKVFISEDKLFTKFHFLQINLVRVNYAEEICQTINRIEQSGLSEKIHRDVLEEKRRNDSYDDKTIDNNEHPLKTDDIIGLIYLLLTGYLISSVVFLTEIL
ncbi:glutamate receptor ionotropic, delta-1-like, partial [Centruroides sculpturatus]|uniref:glutamate receptor ionotropic, delta-1-like n=1 Tax=Centruroides sculpturatus TaxID=218467 RepID=UPI000C6EF11A